MPAKGRGKAGDNEWWKAAIRAAVSRPDEDGRKKLHRIADALVEAAIAGDVAAAREIGDRLDGKAKQVIESNVTVTSLADAIIAASRPDDPADVDRKPAEVRH